MKSSLLKISAKKWLSTIVLLGCTVLVGWLAYDMKTRKRAPVEWLNPQPETLKNKGVHHHIIDSRVLGEPLGVSVYQPQAFAENEPPVVVYFLHGRGGNEHSDVASMVDILLARFDELGLGAPLMVFPNAGASGYWPPFNRVFFDELVPQVEAALYSGTAPLRRLIMGFSLGGSGAVRYAVEQPQMFSGALSFGGGVNFEDEAFRAAAAEAGRHFRDSGFVAYFINGEHDRPNAFAGLAQLWQEEGIDAQQLVVPDIGHPFGLYLERSNHWLSRFIKTSLRIPE